MISNQIVLGRSGSELLEESNLVSYVIDPRSATNGTTRISSQPQTKFTNMASTLRPIVFVDINIGETPSGRIKMELFSDIVPKLVPLTADVRLF
jgi:hypothetical protein